MKAKADFILQKVKNYPVSVFLALVIWVVCLIPVPETPLKNVAFIDKWTHIAMYGILCLSIWVEYLRRHSFIYKKNLLPFREGWGRLLMGGWLLPVLQGGSLELLQAYCTHGTRSGDWLDFLANATGATLILCGGILWVCYHARR